MQLITPPVGPVVALEDLKSYPGIRVDHCEQDADIAALETAAVAHLDGWSGVLGRCIKPQTWRQQAVAAGEWRLPMPDVIFATQNGQPLSIVNGVVTVPVEGDVDLTAAMRPDQLPIAQTIVKMMVAEWFNGSSEIPLAASVLISGLRWARL